MLHLFQINDPLELQSLEWPSRVVNTCCRLWDQRSLIQLSLWTLRRCNNGSSLEIRQTPQFFRTASGPVSVNRGRVAETPAGRWNDSQNAVGTFVAAASCRAWRKSDTDVFQQTNQQTRQWHERTSCAVWLLIAESYKHTKQVALLWEFISMLWCKAFLQLAAKHRSTAINRLPTLI